MIRNRALGVAHFGSFYEAMDCAQHIVRLRPIAVELVDATMIALGRDIAMFRPLIERVVEGEPKRLLLVEFAEDDQAENLRRVAQLASSWAISASASIASGANGAASSKSPIARRRRRSPIFAPRASTSMMSMRDERKPVSFIEDCAVPLEHLADYTARLNEVFARNRHEGHILRARLEGCLHVRPVLNLKLDLDLKRMRAIAEEAFAIVRDTKARIRASTAMASCVRNSTR